MIRPLLVALCVCLAAAAPSSRVSPAAKDPIEGSYIVVFKADAVRADGRYSVAAAAGRGCGP